MKRCLAILLLAACTEHGQTPPGGPIDPDLADPDKPPSNCSCVFDDPPPFDGTCCDTIECYFDEDAGQWQIVICDAFPPPPDPCEQCGIDQLCVQSYDGTCGLVTACVDKTVECPDNACSAECEEAYCSSPLQCQNRVACGTESPLAFTCYGP